MKTKLNQPIFVQVIFIVFSLTFISISEATSIESCEAKVSNGECNSNPTYMLKNCRQECFKDEEFATIGYFSELDEEIKIKSQLRCDDIHVEDEESDSCEDYADRSECLTSPGFMLFKCARSCLVCSEPGEETFPIGKPQGIHPNDINDEDAIEKTVQVIINTFNYMEKVMTQPEYTSVRTLCHNYDEYCAALAADGSCEKPENYEDLPEGDKDAEIYEFMIAECAPACQTCGDFVSDEDALIIKDCMHDPKTNIFGPGDMNRMFERIVGESSEGDVVVSKKDVHIFSRPSHPKDFKGKDDDPTDYFLGPWVVTLDNFLTDEECDRLIQLGTKSGYDRSTLQEEDDYDEEQKASERNGEDAYRTSSNTWCKDECIEDAVTQRVIEKLTNATGIPISYSEDLQLLSYSPGQYYKEHHDIGGDEYYHPSGSRILTFFLYLNNVNEGGATRLTDLTGDDGGIFVDVQPKKGMALIWPSVLDEDPMTMDDRTYHEALTVVKGKKYGANAWFYNRNVKDDDCDYDAFYSIGDKGSDDEESADGDHNHDSSEL